MRILLVEDEHSLGTWLSRALESAGIMVEWVDTARTALASAAAGHHDAIVIDLGLPDRDGQDLLAQIRTRDRHTPALVLTARDTLHDKLRAFNAGAIRAVHRRRTEALAAGGQTGGDQGGLGPANRP